MTNDDKESSQVLSDFFSSVFNDEPNYDNLPEFDSICDGSLDNVNISEDTVLKKISAVKVD